MTKPLYRQPVPAVALAIGAAYIGHRANANAAQSLGVPVTAVLVIIALALAIIGRR
ncbi:MAG TPA: hypothetical protein VGO31_10500 [Microbacteriaceae bacterium]|jgi:hypothetical protein|nr:hypothetical protein [Microbacteriaceae bacterium]